jgi:hypothetical protein
MQRVNLCSANLVGAKLEGVKLSGATLTDALYDRETRWPDSFDPEKYGAVALNSPTRYERLKVRKTLARLPELAVMHQDE